MINVLCEDLKMWACNIKLIKFDLKIIKYLKDINLSIQGSKVGIGNIDLFLKNILYFLLCINSD